MGLHFHTLVTKHPMYHIELQPPEHGASKGKRSNALTYKKSTKRCQSVFGYTRYISSKLYHLKINMDPRSHPSEKEHHLTKPPFFGSMLIFQGVYTSSLTRADTSYITSASTKKVTHNPGPKNVVSE